MIPFFMGLLLLIGLGEQGYKTVVETFVTRPSVLYHVAYETGDGREATLVGTGEHPFYVAERGGADSRSSNTYGAADGGVAVAEPRTRVGGFIAAKELRAGDGLRLSDGRSARVTGVTVQWAPPGEAFTTYNFEVADYHTYFVGEAGVWVHNRGDTPCERVFSQVERLKKKHPTNIKNDEQAFVRLLNELRDTPDGSRQRRRDAILPHLHYSAHAITHTAFKEFADGTVELSQLTTVTTWRETMYGLRAASKVDVHHTAPMEWAIQYLKRANPTKYGHWPDTVTAALRDPDIAAVLNSMPGALMHRVIHRDLGPGIATFHRILNGRLTPGDHNYTPNQIRDGLRDAYLEWSSGFSDDYVNLGPNIFAAARKWLEETAAP